MQADVPRGVTGRVQHVPGLGLGPVEHDRVAVREAAGDARADRGIEPLHREIVGPHRHRQLAREHVEPADVVGVVVRRDDRDQLAALRDERAPPVEPRALLVLVGRGGLDEHHLLGAERVAVGVRRGQERGRQRRKGTDVPRNLSRAHHDPSVDEKERPPVAKHPATARAEAGLVRPTFCR